MKLHHLSFQRAHSQPSFLYFLIVSVNFSCRKRCCRRCCLFPPLRLGFNVSNKPLAFWEQCSIHRTHSLCADEVLMPEETSFHQRKFGKKYQKAGKSLIEAQRSLFKRPYEYGSFGTRFSAGTTDRSRLAFFILLFWIEAEQFTRLCRWASEHPVSDTQRHSTKTTRNAYDSRI